LSVTERDTTGSLIGSTTESQFVKYADSSGHQDQEHYYDDYVELPQPTSGYYSLYENYFHHGKSRIISSEEIHTSNQEETNETHSNHSIDNELWKSVDDSFKEQDFR